MNESPRISISNLQAKKCVSAVGSQRNRIPKGVSRSMGWMLEMASGLVVMDADDTLVCEATSGVIETDGVAAFDRLHLENMAEDYLGMEFVFLNARCTST